MSVELLLELLQRIAAPINKLEELEPLLRTAFLMWPFHSRLAIGESTTIEKGVADDSIGLQNLTEDLELNVAKTILMSPEAEDAASRLTIFDNMFLQSKDRMRNLNLLGRELHFLELEKRTETIHLDCKLSEYGKYIVK